MNFIIHLVEGAEVKSHPQVIKLRFEWFKVELH